MKPMAPENMQPTRKATVRAVPDWRKVMAASPTWPSSSLLMAVEVTNTTMARGTTIIPMVRNWRLRYAEAPSWMAPAISCISWVPGSWASTPRMRM